VHFALGSPAAIWIAVLLLSLLSVVTTFLGVGLALYLLGAAIVATLHVIIPHTHLVEEKGKLDPRLLRSAYFVAFGLILHDFPEAFAMANSYVASPSIGILVALAMVSTTFRRSSPWRPPPLPSAGSASSSGRPSSPRSPNRQAPSSGFSPFASTPA